MEDIYKEKLEVLLEALEFQHIDIILELPLDQIKSIGEAYREMIKGITGR